MARLMVRTASTRLASRALHVSFAAMKLLELGSNMSLDGIAIAVGAMIDGAIIMIENA